MNRLLATLFHPANLPRTAVAGLLISFILLFPMTRPEDPDVWFHLSSGRHLWANGEYPGMDSFLYTYPSFEPSHHHEWLFQALIYPLYTLLGMAGLVAVKSLLLGASFLLLFFMAQRRRSFYFAAAYCLVVFAAGSGRFYIRPEVAGGLALAVLWAALSRPLTRTSALTMVALQVLWTNLHWSSILSVAVVGAYTVADLAGRLLPLPPRWSTGTDGNRWYSYPLLLAGVMLGTLLNPDSFLPFLEPFRYFLGKDFLLPIAEVWPMHLSLFRPGGPTFHLWFFWALGLGALSFILNFKRINLAHLLSFAGLAVTTLAAERHVLFFALIALPTVLHNLASLLPERPRSHTRELAVSLVCAFLLMTLIMNKVTGIQFLVPYPKPYEPLSAAASRFLWPRAAADFLVEEDLPDAVFNNFNSGNYLNWAIFPRRIFINGTLTHRKTEEVYAWIRQRPEQWDRLAGEWGIETVFFRLTPIIAPSALLQQIVNHPGWKLVFYDGTAAVLVRDDPEHPDTRAIPAVDLGKELQSSVREILSNASRVPGSSLPLWGEIVQYTWRQDLARLFRLRGQFYLLAGRPDLAATAAEMVRNLEG